ncbi:o-succinylbenzoate synthase [Rhodocytophaga rosea]|uniref:o-succinylbenzoate synthase n=1 Tax=Rhodocytophaga rosea TaxID=2704465 RepID=UPI00293BDB76|nr:o-succinylbenzoate synthase [Rhodocytophaga rosea]
MQKICQQLPEWLTQTSEWYTDEGIEKMIGLIGNTLPAIQFGVETALLDLRNGGKRIIFKNDFSAGKTGIPINGLIWMGKPEFMRQQIDEKLMQGYTCLKLKIGALDFDKECELLGYIRKQYPAEQITLRVDANGAFSTGDALEKLKILAQYDLHSIEQPIRQGQWSEMASLCRHTPLLIALDEELIGVIDKKQELLQTIHPQFIILKPSLLGGFHHSLEWIKLAEKMNIGWWITSALESNIGLNAISQFTASLNNPLPQGLGTGQLYSNNITSPLEISKGYLHYNLARSWSDILKMERSIKNYF